MAIIDCVAGQIVNGGFYNAANKQNTIQCCFLPLDNMQSKTWIKTYLHNIEHCQSIEKC